MGFRFILIRLLVFIAFLPIHVIGGPKERSFRPIVPIKQNVSTDEAQSISQKVSVTIPPQPAPKLDSSLFPKNSVPEIDFPPETEVSLENEEDSETTEKEEEEKRKDGPTINQLREEAHKLADMGLNYIFGADNPKTGGLDCSGAVQYVLNKIGIQDVPRTSYDQYYWLKKKKLLDDVHGKGASKKLLKKLSPGDLIFWGGTWKSGHRVSHVMIYMGFNPTDDTHYVFGARGKTAEGLLGNGVDIFELDPDRGRLIAHGKVPGLVY